MEPQELRATEDLSDLPVGQDLLDHKVQLEIVENQALLEIKETLVAVDHQDLRETLAHVVTPDQVENVVILACLDNLERWEFPDSKDHQDQPELSENLDPLVALDHLAVQDSQEPLVLMAPVVLWEREDQQEKTEPKDPLDQWEAWDQEEHLDQVVMMEYPENVEHLVKMV